MNPSNEREAFRGVRVLVTGHTGFKGSWLCSWLQSCGAEISGLALAPESDRPSLFDELQLAQQMRSHIGDIRDLDTVTRCLAAAAPEIIFHLAAQPLVRRSYADPLGTFATNVMGTAHLLEAARHQPSVRAIVCVTTDKCYENRDWVWGYRETDPLGGHDPYSASKAAAEFIADSYRKSFFVDKTSIVLATARGGNVLGGGDWSENRLVPDLARSRLERRPLVLRNPEAVRPWQHVLELVRGYCLLGVRLLRGDQAAAGAWNFGPALGNELTVRELVTRLVKLWDKAGEFDIQLQPSSLKEAHHLRLDSSKARALLGWEPQLGIDETAALTVDWYRCHADDSKAAARLVRSQLAAYQTGSVPESRSGES
jgi:CDP-glucose 4,6-dehydratase